MKLRSKFNHKGVTVLIAAIALFISAIGIINGFTGLLLIPVAAAFLSAFLAIDEKKIVTICLSIAIILLDFFFGMLFFSLISVISALIIHIFFKKGLKKSECAGVLTVLIFLAVLLLAVLLAFSYSGANTIDDIINFYSTEFKKIETTLIEYVEDLKDAGQLSGYEDLYESEHISNTFSIYGKFVIAIIVILSFLMSGIALKIYSVVMSKLIENTEKISTWRFIPSAVFAWFYVILALVSLFITNTEGLFALSVLNLEAIFSIVFAYIGIMFVSGLLAMRNRNPITSLIIVAVGILILSSLAIRLLAITGAIIVIMNSKLEASFDSTFTNNTTNKKE